MQDTAANQTRSEPPRPARAGAPGQATGGAGNYTEGSVAAHIVKLSGFMMIGFLAMTVAQFVEAIYLGQVGADELAAVAFTFPITLGLNAMARGIGIGAGAVVARAMGSRDRPLAQQLVSHCLLLVLLFAVACLALMLMFPTPLFVLMGASGHVLELTVAYTQIWFLGFPLLALSMVGSGLIRSVGDAAFPGYVMTLGSVLQMLFAPFLIFGWVGLPAMGIEGAAWGFVAARLISFAMTVWWFVRKESMLVWQLEHFKASAVSIMHVGLPATLTNLIPSVSTAVITRLLADYGHGVVAGFGVASRVESLVAMVVIAISSSTGPMVGQNWGARSFDRVHESLRLCYRFCLGWGVLAAAIMWVSAEFLVTQINNDPALVDTAVSYLHIIPFSIGFMGMMNVASSAFNSLSKPIPPLVLSLLRMLVLYLPMAIIAGQFWGYDGIFVATALANLIMGIAAWQWNRTVIHKEQARLTAGTPIA